MLTGNQNNLLKCFKSIDGKPLGNVFYALCTKQQFYHV